MDPAARRARRVVLAIIATALVCLACALVVAVEWRSRQHPASLGRLAPEFATLSERMAVLEVRLTGKTLTLERRGAGWRAVERGGYPIAGAQMAQTLAAIGTVQRIRAMTRQRRNLDLLFLNDPPTDGSGVRVIGRDAQGAILADVTLGYSAKGDAKVYGRRGEDAQAYAVTNAPAGLNRLEGWLDVSPLPFVRADIARMEIVPQSGPAYALRRDAAPQDFRLEPPFAQLAIVSPLGVWASAHAIVGVAPFDVAPLAVASGTDRTSLGRFTATTFSGVSVDGQVWREGERYWMALNARAPEPRETARAAALDELIRPWAFAINDLDARTLTTPLSDLVRSAL